MSRSWPSMVRVYASVARTTTSARTVPCSVRTAPVSIERTAVRFVDHPAQPLDLDGQTACQASRVHGGGVGGEQPAADAGCVHDLRGRLGVEQRPRVAEPVTDQLLVVLAHPAQLAVVDGEVDARRPCGTRSRCRASATTAPTSSTLRCISRAIRSTEPAPPALRDHLRPGRRSRRRTSRRCGPRHRTRRVTLEHDDAHRRVGAQQRVRGPEPGEAGADDGDVGVAVDASAGRGARASPGSSESCQ